MPVSLHKNSDLKPYWQSECGRAAVYVGDNMQVMLHMQDSQFHAVVTDPPYGLEFMGKEWDAPWKNSGVVETANEGTDKSHPFRDGTQRVRYGNKGAVVNDPAKERGGFQDGSGGNAYSRSRVEYGRDSMLFQQWFFDRATQMLRVAHPGAHLFSFGGTRMFHRMACAVEDAGWEIRDCVMWLYGCLSQDTEILTKDGWKKYQDIHCGLEVMAWDSETEELRLEEVQKVTVAPYKGKMFKFHNDNTDQLLTPNHRVYKKHAQRFQSDGVRTTWFEEKWSVKQTKDINRYQAIKLPLAGYHSGVGIGGNAYAELLGWVFTEGGFDTSGTGVRITQSSVNQDKVEMICQCLAANNISAKHYHRERTYKNRQYIEHTWYFSGEPAIKVRESLPDKHPTWSLLWGMTINEKRAFFNSSMLGDGSGMAFFQKDDADREWFQALAHCIGMQGRDNPNKSCVALHDNATTELQRRHLQDWYEDYDGVVWCVTVTSGAFVARRNGKVFITGNSGFPKSMDVSKQIDAMYGAERVAVGKASSGLGAGQFTREAGLDAGYGFKSEYEVTSPATDDAKRWNGWGTALKPAWEPVIMARKPMDLNTAQNVLEHGTGALNIDVCRVGDSGGTGSRGEPSRLNAVYGDGMGGQEIVDIGKGRWPANVITDGSEEQLSRYFYSAKADSTDRPHGKGGHPTVKPLDLMRYLVKMVCPRGGVVLDPFMGSGSTGVAATAEGMNFVGIEQSQEYADIAVGRLKLALQSAPDAVKLVTKTMVAVSKDVPPPTPKKLRLK